MCGRFGLFSSIEVIKKLLNLEEADEIAPRYNISPSQPVAGVRMSDTDQQEMGLFRWGLVPSWMDRVPASVAMINARSETVFEKPAFRILIKRRRCLIPADGFYEWQKQGSQKKPYFFRMKTGAPFAFAGLWDEWEGGGERVVSCTVLTTAANELVRPVHDRMPVIIRPANYDAWLDPRQWDQAAIQEAFIPYPSELMGKHPVSNRVNRPGYESADCVEAVGESGDSWSQCTLFS
jgi:putative SOS response-associated peptidase YedK